MRSMETSSSSGKLRMKRLCQRYGVSYHREYICAGATTHLERSSSTSSRVLFLNEKAGGADELDATGWSGIGGPGIQAV